ncbi:MAG: CapA family protein [Candidatus Aminicenantes bacterium]|nr:CapA family protein [Candidatus Aminicenantes bacterium]
MKSKLPETPLDALNISGALRAAVKTIHTWADVSGCWKYPSKKAAGDFEDMSLMDKIYWGYKSKKPITRAEKGSGLESFFKSNTAPITLPEGFETKHTVTFGAAGDLIKVDGLENSRDQLYEGVTDLLFNNDISYANLESQLTNQDLGAYTFSEKETPPLCCTKEQYDALKSHKGKQYSALHMACNHTLDMGLEGLETTLAQLREDNIMELGVNRDPGEQKKGRIIEKNGLKIGFVSATYGLNGKTIPQGKEYMVNVVPFHHKDPSGNKADISLLNRQIFDCKEQKCDIIIASLHWGYEYEFFPRRAQVDMAHEIIEMGVDAIVSHHAHVLQPMEFYRPQRDPEKTAVIAYSLGNLTSSFSAPHIVLNAILNLTFVKGTVNGEEKAFIQGAQLTPVVQVESLDGDLPVLRIEKLETLSAKKSEPGAEKDYISAIERYAALVSGR